MMRAVLADTGPLYAAVDPHDSHHEQALSDLSKLADQKREVILLYPILLEAYTMVLRRLGKSVVANWLNEIAEAAMLNPTPEDYRDAVTRVRALGDQDISLFDATVATMAIRMGFEVWTYDHHFDVMRAPVWRC